MDYLEKDKSWVLNTYTRLPIDIDKVRGSYIYSRDGSKYLDFFSGIAVNSLGYDEVLIDAVISKLKRYAHTSNYFVDDDRSELARLLCENSTGSKVFFTNSGAESAEAALKIVRKWGHVRGKYGILTASKSFHGRTTGALALTGQEKYQKDFEPLMPGISHFTFNDEDELTASVNSKTAAVIVEPVQGEGGVVPMSTSFARTIMKLREKFSFLLVVDEIQTGLRRCKTMFAYEKLNLEPDVILLAKSLGGGLPLGAVIVSKNCEDVLNKGDHGSTFGGNPAACAGGLAVMQRLMDEVFTETLNNNSAYLMARMIELKDTYPHMVRDVRGTGMMIGVDTYGQASRIRDEAFNHKLLLNVTAVNVIRLLPPLTVSREEIDICADIMTHVMSEMRV